MNVASATPIDQFAKKRLHRDLKELQRESEHLTTISALPTNDFFKWHCNLRPEIGPYKNCVFHIILEFDESYPRYPPIVKLCTTIPHPNVFDGAPQYYPYICLDLLKDNSTGTPYEGWSSAYSVMSLLLQLQSFLFDENVPQDWGGMTGMESIDWGDLEFSNAAPSQPSISEAIAKARRFRCMIDTCDGKVTHTHDDPWPPLPPRPTSTDEVAVRSFASRWSPPPRLTNTPSLPPRPVSTDEDVAQTFASRWSPPPRLIDTPLLPPRPMSTYEAAGHSLGSRWIPPPRLTDAPYAGYNRASRARPSKLTCSVQTSDAKTTPTVVVPSTTRSDASVYKLLALPSFVSAHLFSFLSPNGVLQVRDVCSTWRRIAITFNLFERPQIMCFHSKKTLDDGCVLGVGINVKYHQDMNLKWASSPLDLLSLEAFFDEGVSTGVWGGIDDRFEFFLPLIINNGHAKKALPTIADVIHTVMQWVPSKGLKVEKGRIESYLEPVWVLQFVSVLMNSMVVELIKDVGDEYTRGINRHASEKALEGYCAFHHMLLYFACRYPSIVEDANRQIDEFIVSEKARRKQSTPNLGLLLVCLTVSRKGWQSLWKPFLLEVFDRNVKWLVEKDTDFGRPDTFRDLPLLARTLTESITSYRLLMFQVYFMSQIGRPAGSNGPADVLASYDKRLGRPTTAQKEQLQQACKDILAARTWREVFARLEVPMPPPSRLATMLRKAVAKSEHKGYHRKVRPETYSWMVR